MAITPRAVGAWSASTTSPTVTLPTHQTGDMLIVRVTWKSDVAASANASIATTGWNKIGQGNNGTTNSSNGGGSVFVAAFYKVAESNAETNPTVTFADANPAAVVAISYQKAATEVWDTPVGNSGPDTTSNTAHSATIASHITVRNRDVVDFFTGIADDTTMTVPTITQTGVTYSTVTEYPATALTSTTGFDISADGGYRTATAGTSSAAAVVTGTLSTAETGTSWMTRLRVVFAGSGQAQARIKAFGVTNFGQAQADILAATASRGHAQAAALILPPGDTIKVLDFFERSESGTWGNAPLGGSWANTDFEYSVANGVGIDNISAADSDDTILDTTWTEQEMLYTIALDRLATGDDIPTYGLIRAVGEDDYYRIGVIFETDNIIDVELAAVVAGTPTNIITATSTGVAISANQAYFVRIQAFGTNPTRIKARVWAVDTAEPGTWIIDTTDSTATLQAPGSVGFRQVGRAAFNNYPINFMYDSLLGIEPSQAPNTKVYAQAMATITPQSGLPGNVVLEESITNNAVATSLVMPSWAPGADELLILSISTRGTRTVSSISGNGVTWDLVASVIDSQSQEGHHVYRAQDPAPSSGSITINVSGTANTIVAHAHRFSGTVIGSNGASALEDITTNEVGATDNQDFLVAITTSTDRAWAFASGNHRQRTFTASGETVILDNSAGISGDILSCISMYIITDPAATVTLGGTTSLNAVAEWVIVGFGIIPATTASPEVYVVGQAQAQIKTTYNTHGQAQANVKNTYRGHGQTQAWIENTYRGHAQANAWIENTYRGHAQSQGWIENTYRGHAQSQAQIKNTYRWHAQAQARISKTSSVVAQAQARIKTENYVVGQTQAKIKAFGVTRHGQAQARIGSGGPLIWLQDTFTRTLDQSLGTPDIGSPYTNIYTTGTEDYDIDGSKLIIRSAPTDGYVYLEAYNKSSAHNSDITIDFRIPTPVGIVTFYNVALRARLDFGSPSGNYIEAAVYDNGLGPQIFLNISPSGGINASDEKDIPAIEYGEWYTLKLRVEGTNVSTKAWKKNELESSWAITLPLDAITTPVNAGFYFWLEIDSTATDTLEIDNYFITEVLNASHGQAQAEIAVAAAVTRTQVAQAQARIKQVYSSVAQSQARIKNTYNGLGQAQARIKNTYSSVAQAQARIKNVYSAVAQAQADIKQTYRSHAQAQARIKQVYNSVAQARAWIENTYSNVGQAASWIENTYRGHGQANAQIKQTYNSVAQAQAYILGINYARAQAQAQIKQVYASVAQAQAQLKRTYSSVAQAQALISQSYFGVAQAQARILRTYTAVGQTQADIKATSTVVAQAQADIKQAYRVHAQAQAVIRNTYFAVAQSQARIKQSYFALAQAQATIRGNMHGQAQGQIKQTYNFVAQSAAVIRNTYSSVAQANAWIEQTYSNVAQAQARIKQVYISVAQAQADIKQTYRAHAQAQAYIKMVGRNTHGQAQARVRNTYISVAQAQARLIAFGVNAHAQAQANIRFDGNAVFGQAQAKINAFGYPQHGQAQAEVKQTYRSHAQAQATIEQVYSQVAQAQARILQTYTQVAQAQGTIRTTYFAVAQANAYIILSGRTSVAQAQATIRDTYESVAQAQALIKRTENAVGQAQGTIEQIYNAHGQAQGQIKQTYRAHAQTAAVVENTYSAVGQAQAWIKAFGINVHGQAQANISFEGNAVHGQAQAKIKGIGVNNHGQAQGWVETTYRAYGQAQADIRDTYEQHGQANALIVTSRQVHAQAQGTIKRTYNASGQAQGWIENTYVATGQAAAIVRNTYSGSGQATAYIKLVQSATGQAQAALRVAGRAHGQAQGTILRTYVAVGNAQARIRTTVNSSGQAQALVTNRYTVSGQAQALITTGRVIIGQAQAFIVRHEIYGQAQALIATTHTLANVLVDDEHVFVVGLDDEVDDIGLDVEDEVIEPDTELDEETFTITLSDEHPFTIVLEDTAFI